MMKNRSGKATEPRPIGQPLWVVGWKGSRRLHVQADYERMYDWTICGIKILKDTFDAVNPTCLRCIKMGGLQYCRGEYGQAIDAQMAQEKKK